MKIEQESSGEENPIIQYVNIVHGYGVGSSEALSFKYQYENDRAFQRRAGVLELLIDNKHLFKVI